MTGARKKKLPVFVLQTQKNYACSAGLARQVLVWHSIDQDIHFLRFLRYGNEIRLVLP